MKQAHGHKKNFVLLRESRVGRSVRPPAFGAMRLFVENSFCCFLLNRREERDLVYKLGIGVARPLLLSQQHSTVWLTRQAGDAAKATATAEAACSRPAECPQNDVVFYESTQLERVRTSSLLGKCCEPKFVLPCPLESKPQNRKRQKQLPRAQTNTHTHTPQTNLLPSDPLARCEHIVRSAVPHRYADGEVLK